MKNLMLAPNAILGAMGRNSLVPQAPAWEFILSVMGSLLSFGIGCIFIVLIPNVDIGDEGSIVQYV